MDKNILIQYLDILKERKDILKRIEKLENKNSVIDSVKGSDENFPYIKRNYIISGVDTSKESSIKKLEKSLMNFEQILLEKQTEIESFIQNIEDSQTRLIFRMRYMDNLSWLQIMHKLNYTSESTARSIHDRYLEKI